MGLVTYSDSETSDSETDSKPRTQTAQEKKVPSASAKPSKPASSSEFQPLVDRNNPRKIRVNLPEIKPENGGKDEEDDGAPARKKPRVGAAGQFSGFNSLLPAPKRNTLSGAKGGAKDGNDKKSAPAPKVFSLKTGATPGFDRSADAEMRQGFAQNGATDGDERDEDVTGISGENTAVSSTVEEKAEEPTTKKSAMMFKPLSVGRNTTQKKRPAASSENGLSKSRGMNEHRNYEKDSSLSQQPEPPPKPKVSLFGFSKEEKTVPSSNLTSQGSYEPMVYSTGLPTSTTEADDTQLDVSAHETGSQMPMAPGPNEPPTLNSIADDLNLSRAEKRHLFGRNAKSSFTDSTTSSSAPRILTFNTDAEYASNQALLSSTSESERAALQHNPVRSIAPGKHNLQQLVNAASNQREALEESFASGKRNKKEAGSRYGW